MEYKYMRKGLNKIILATSLALTGFSAQAENFTMMYNITGIKPKGAKQAQGVSCNTILAENPAAASGIYSIESPSGQVINVYCNMTAQGGGWTLVVAQYEQDPVTNWNEGIQSDYDPSLVTQKGFALNSEQLPDHTQMAIGKDLLAADVDYFNYTYTTGDIDKTLLSGLKAGEGYHIYRNELNHYGSGDPEGGISLSSSWNNMLTIDAVGGSKYSWAFFPLASRAGSGYAYGGVGMGGAYNDFAWTVWVR